MDKTWRHNTKKILDFTLEIISLLTGEHLPPVKSGDHVTITVPPDHYMVTEKHNKQKILEITRKMMELLMGEGEEVVDIRVRVKQEPEELGSDWQRTEEGKMMRTIKQEDFPTEICPAHLDDARNPSDGWLALLEHCRIEKDDIAVDYPIEDPVSPNIQAGQNTVRRPEAPLNKEVIPCYLNTSPGHHVVQRQPDPKESSSYNSLNVTSNNQPGHTVVVGRPPAPTIPQESSFKSFNATSHGESGHPPGVISTAPSTSRAPSPCIILLMPSNSQPLSRSVIQQAVPSKPETSSPHIPLTIIPTSNNIVNIPPSSTNLEALSTHMPLSITSNIHTGHGIVKKTASPLNPKIPSSQISLLVPPNIYAGQIHMDKLPGPLNPETSYTTISLATTSNTHPGPDTSEKKLAAALNSEKPSSQLFLPHPTPNAHPRQLNLDRPPVISNPEASCHHKSLPVTLDIKQENQLSDTQSTLSKPNSHCTSVPPNIHPGHSSLDRPTAFSNSEAPFPDVSLITQNTQTLYQIPDDPSTFSNFKVSSACTPPSVTPDIFLGNSSVDWPPSYQNPITPNCSFILYSANRQPEVSKPVESHVRVPINPENCCPECGKYFQNKSGLRAHFRSHTGEKPFSCPECGKLFRHKSHLTAHVRLHTGEGLLVCSECGKTYLFKSHLNEHYKIHTGQKPHSCHQCGLQFSFKRDLKRHLTIHL